MYEIIAYRNKWEAWSNEEKPRVFREQCVTNSWEDRREYKKRMINSFYFHKF